MQKAKSLRNYYSLFFCGSVDSVCGGGLTPHAESWAPIGHPKHHMASVISFPCTEPFLQCYMYVHSGVVLTCLNMFFQ